MRTFDDYEKLAVESKMVLFNIHIELQKFESDNKEHRKMDNGVNFYIWKQEQKDKISEKGYHRGNYLESWAKGDFSECDYHADFF
jgi:hypothetical protein